MAKYRVYGMEDGSMVTYDAADIIEANMLMITKFAEPNFCGIIRKDADGWRFVVGTISFASWFSKGATLSMKYKEE